jgi:hypothetical protein
MQCLKIELHAVTAVTAVVAVMMVVAAAALYLPIEIKKSRKMILQGEN